MQGDFDWTQISHVGFTQLISSKVPAFMMTTLGSKSGMSMLIPLPHFPQKRRTTSFPLSDLDLYSANSPEVISKSFFGRRIVALKKLPPDLWQSLQWQRNDLEDLAEI
jgi:hypothetical protein